MSARDNWWYANGDAGMQQYMMDGEGIRPVTQADIDAANAQDQQMQTSSQDEVRRYIQEARDRGDTTLGDPFSSEGWGGGPTIIGTPGVDQQGLYNWGNGLMSYVPMGDSRFVPKPQHNDSFTSPGGFFGGIVGTTKTHAEDTAHAYQKDPERAVLGINTPLESKAWGTVLGKHYEPTTTMGGGPTQRTYDNASAAGYSTGPTRTGHTLAPAVVSIGMAGGLSGAESASGGAELSGTSGTESLYGNPATDSLAGSSSMDGGAMDMYGVNNPPSNDIYSASDTPFPDSGSSGALSQTDTAAAAPSNSAPPADTGYGPPTEQTPPANNAQMDQAITSGQEPTAAQDKGILSKLGEWSGLGESGTKLAIAGALALAQSQANKRSKSNSQQNLQNVQNQQYPGFNMALQPGKGLSFSDPNYNPYFSMGMTGPVGSPGSKYIGPQPVPQYFTRQARGGLAGVGPAGGRPLHTSNVGPLSAHSLVKGPGGGQDDQIPAALSDGEYVMDADTVSALGDGSNDHGAKKLDAMRESIRKHKRSSSPKKIPPKAKQPEAYLRGGFN